MAKSLYRCSGPGIETAQSEAEIGEQGGFVVDHLDLPLSLWS
jgi:hypothetical protein